MKALLFAGIAFFLFSAVACDFMRYATSPQKDAAGVDQGPPLVQVVKESAGAGLTGFQEYGIYGGVLAFVATFAKSFARIYSEYQKSKALDQLASKATIAAAGSSPPPV